jgi:hypothetical protein
MASSEEPAAALGMRRIKRERMSPSVNNDASTSANMSKCTQHTNGRSTQYAYDLA